MLMASIQSPDVAWKPTRCWPAGHRRLLAPPRGPPNKGRSRAVAAWEARSNAIVAIEAAAALRIWCPPPSRSETQRSVRAARDGRLRRDRSPPEALERDGTSRPRFPDRLDAPRRRAISGLQRAAEAASRLVRAPCDPSGRARAAAPGIAIHRDRVALPLPMTVLAEMRENRTGWTGVRARRHAREQQPRQGKSPQGEGPRYQHDQSPRPTLGLRWVRAYWLFAASPLLP
jgi:hypothetical protein